MKKNAYTERNTPWSRVSFVPVGQAEKYARSFEARYPAVAARCNGRIEDAIRLCSTICACGKGEFPGTFLVHTKVGAFQVDPMHGSCTCKINEPATPCVHRLAIGFHLFGPDWIYEDWINTLPHRTEREF